MSQSNDAVGLFSPIEFAGQTLKNRMVLAPLTRGRAGPDRIPNALMAEYYTQRSGGGLAITEAIIHHHGGMLEVESEPGKGTQITIRIPQEAYEHGSQEESVDRRR